MNLFALFIRLFKEDNLDEKFKGLKFMWLKDPKTNLPSVTLTFFAFGFVMAVMKLVVSDVELGGIKFGSFSGTDFSMVVASLGAIYTLRRAGNNKQEDTKQ